MKAILHFLLCCFHSIFGILRNVYSVDKEDFMSFGMSRSAEYGYFDKKTSCENTLASVRGAGVLIGFISTALAACLPSALDFP